MGVLYRNEQIEQHDRSNDRIQEEKDDGQGTAFIDAVPIPCAQAYLKHGRYCRQIRSIFFQLLRAIWALQSTHFHGNLPVKWRTRTRIQVKIHKTRQKRPKCLWTSAKQCSYEWNCRRTLYSPWRSCAQMAPKADYHDQIVSIWWISEVLRCSIVLFWSYIDATWLGYKRIRQIRAIRKDLPSQLSANSSQTESYLSKPESSYLQDAPMQPFPSKTRAKHKKSEQYQTNSSRLWSRYEGCRTLDTIDTTIRP